MENQKNKTIKDVTVMDFHEKHANLTNLKSTKLVSAFKCILNHNIEPLAEADRQEAYNILMEESLDNFLGYLENKGSISKSIREFLGLELFLYEIDDNGNYLNYYEEDFDKRNELIEVVFDGQVGKYAENYEG